MTYLTHVTLNTGHTRRSDRGEVADSVIATLRPLLVEALQRHVAVPGLAAGMTLTGAKEGRCSIWTVWTPTADGRRAPVVTFGVALHSRCGRRLWRLLHEDAERTIEMATDPARCPPEPWIGARVDIGAVLVPAEVPLRLGDLERCAAWALVEMQEDLSPAMTDLFVTRSGRVVPERDTDQAGTGLKIRTVSRYTDGRAIDRPQLCVSIGERRHYADQRAYETAIAEAAGRAERLDRRGHVLWDAEDYIRPEGWPVFAATQLAGRSPELIEALRCILVEGMPIGEATGETDSNRRKNARTTLRRILKDLGWSAA